MKKHLLIATVVATMSVAAVADIAVKGEIGPVGVTAEYFFGINDTRGAAGLGDDADAYLVHLSTKLAEITWHAVYAHTDAGVAGITGSGNKFSPLGVSFLATAPGGKGATAFANFGDADDSIFGVRADLKLAGMGVQVAAGQLELQENIITSDIDGFFWDIIVKRPLGKSSDLKLSVGDYEGTTSLGAKISIKF